MTCRRSSPNWNAFWSRRVTANNSLPRLTHSHPESRIPRTKSEAALGFGVASGGKDGVE
jgi:hypothetical protein